MKPSGLFLEIPGFTTCAEEQKDDAIFSLSCEIGAGGIKIPRVDLEVKREGTTLLTTGEQLGVVEPADLEYCERLGKGASGHVQKAFHRKFKVPLAIKMMGVYEKEKRHQLVNELVTLLKNDCPFLINCYGAYYDDGKVNVVLEFMDSGSIGTLTRLLVKKLPASQPFVIPEVVLSKITHQVLQGLENLHHVRYQVHRDIKPDNILLNSNGEVKLTDFGISKHLELTLGLCNTFVGTSAYMSPERISSADYSYPSDIWSLGVVLIEFATGEYPYQAPSSYIELYHCISQQDPPTLQDHPYYSAEFKHFLGCCLRKDPRHRSTARQLLDHPWILAYRDRDQDLRVWVEKANFAREELLLEQKMKREATDYKALGLSNLEGMM